MGDPCLGDTNTHAPHMCQFPYKIKSEYSQQKKQKICTLSRQHTYLLHARATHFSAGVQTMRARICSAFSCDMFARVVWLKPWGAAKPPTYSISPLSHALATHYFLRLTRARGRCFLRGRKALLNDFWYFWSRKSTIKESYFMILLFQSSFRLSEKNEKDKKRKEFLF